MSTDLLLLAAKARHGDTNLTRRQRRVLARSLRARRFAAGLVVDLAQTCDYFPSLTSISGQSTAVGGIVDLLHANTNCQVYVATTHGTSGPLPILIQTSPTTASGDFTDPTSGLHAGAFPVGGKVASGGVFWANSGLFASGNSSPGQNRIDNAPLFASGGIDFASFQRPHRYARLVCTSGNATIGAAIFTAGFLSQKKITGSGGGFTLAPGSGSVNV